MKPRSAALLFALLAAVATVVTVDAWRRHGKTELARLAKEAQEAKAGLKDAVKADKEVVRHYVYDSWPYWWGSPRYGWWEDRTTYIYMQPQPAPAPQKRAEAAVAPEVAVEAPRPAPQARPQPPAWSRTWEGPPAAAPVKRVRRQVPPL
ncbi:hypothetical protein EPO15_15275 [bacterium]|nr:MAG: hypothetical protein EPO15_15275 [bacterium]